MKNILLVAALFLHSCWLCAQMPANSLSGMVTDSTTGKPLTGVSVYFNNTSKGTVTRADGSFLLTDLPRGIYELVFSAIGYRTFIAGFNSSRPPPSMHIFLSRKAEELASVTVAPYEKHGWRKYGRFFLDNFIGTTENAGSCKLQNPEVLRFYFSKRSNRLFATAAEPLVIQNNALGYLLTYQLEGFTADFTEKVVSYVGYPFFQQLTPKRESLRKKWEFMRKQAYTGSKMHFMRSLYAGRLITEGFLMEKEIMAPNTEKERVKEIYRPDFQKPGMFPMDTLYYFWKVLKQPDPIKTTVVVLPDSILTAYPDGTRELFFDQPLTILYGVNNYGVRMGDTTEFRNSFLRMLVPEMVKVEENGSYYPPKAFAEGGYWGLHEKICNLLPLDYRP